MIFYGTCCNHHHNISLMCISIKVSEVNLSAFIYRLKANAGESFCYIRNSEQQHMQGD